MNKRTKHVVSILAAFLLCTSMGGRAYASDGPEYITISVDAKDNNGDLLYALDTDDPAAFSVSNEFSVPAGTSHTIYVKDSAGNITSQEYAPYETSYEEAYLTEEEGRDVNIDITLDDIPREPDYEYAGDLMKDPAEAGQGTVYEKVEVLANDSDAQRLFYTVTTDEGEVFYLVIDQNQSSNNVYLLDQVNLSDLHALAVNDSGSKESDDSLSLLSALNGSAGSGNTEDPLSEENGQNSGSGNSMAGKLILVLIIAAAGAGIYYYRNVYQNKKDEQMDLIDAPEKDDFAVEEEEDEEEMDFGLDDDYQEQIMAQLLDEDTQDIPDEQDIPEPEKERTDDEIYDEYDDDLDGPDEEEEDE